MGRALRVLIIEDSIDDTEILLWELRRGGFEPEWERVERGGEMVAALERRAWDVIISDFVMPGFSGLEALRLLQARGLDIPFIILSGKVGEETAVEAMRAGAHDYLLKGNMARLLPAIRRELAEAEIRAERRRAEQELRILKEAIETIPLGVTITDPQGNIIYTNPAEAAMHGYGVEELLGEHSRIFAPPDLWNKTAMPLDDYVTSSRESVNIRKNGEHFPVQLISNAVYGAAGEPLGVITICEEITARKQTEERLRFMSTHDSLTGLYNRSYFELELERLNRSRLFPVSVVMVDVDGLKLVNDTKGHAVGDLLLQQAAKVLGMAFRAEDMVARIGGDEFVVLLPEADSLVVDRAVQRIRSTLEENHFALGEPVSLSLGAATALESGTLLETIRLADERMYEDKLTRLCRDRRQGPTSRR